MVVAVDAGITGRRHRAIFATVAVDTVAHAAIGLVLVLSGAVATAVQGRLAWWRHATILACEATSALADAVISAR
jgi:hypothetical protein